MKKKDLNKILKKGDEYMKKGKPKKALKKYLEAKEVDPKNPDVYDKLIESHASSTDEWTKEDFIESMSWLMTKQEIEHPKIRALHQRLSPEWRDISDLISKMLGAKDEVEEEKHIEDLCRHGENALRPLIEFILALKHIKDAPSED